MFVEQLMFHPYDFKSLNVNPVAANLCGFLQRQKFLCKIGAFRLSAYGHTHFGRYL